MREDIKERIEKARCQEILDGYVLQYKYRCPADWKMYSLGEITKRVSVKNKNAQGHPVYSISNQAGFIPQDEQFAQGSYIDLDKSDYKIVRQGEFAYNPARINVGSIGLLKEEKTAIVSSLYVCFSVREKCDTNYFSQWIQSYDFYKEVLRNLEGSVREYLFYKNFSKIRIVIPDKCEQKKIATILDHCDKIIELKRQLIEEECKQKKWLMHKLLAWQAHHKKLTIGTLAEVCSGATPPTTVPEYWGGTIQWMSSGELNLKRIYHVEKFITEDGLLNSGTKLLPPKCVLIGLAGQGKTRGTVAINYISLCTNQSIAAIIPNERFDSEYLYWNLENRYAELRKISSGDGARGGLNLDLIKNLILYLPPLEEQKKSASILTAAEAKIHLLEQELSQWQQKKKALMQLLLTGLVRV